MNIRKIRSTLIVSLMLNLALTVGVSGAILIAFEEVGLDTKVTLSGSLDLTDMTPLALNVNRTQFFGARTDPGRILGHLHGLESQWWTFSGGVETIFPMELGTNNPNLYQGDIFGIAMFEASPGVFGAVLHLPGDLTASSTSVTVNGAWIFANRSIADSWGEISTTPRTIFNTGGTSNDVVQIVQVPEPSSSMLVSLGAGLTLLRRKRTS